MRKVNEKLMKYKEDSRLFLFVLKEETLIVEYVVPNSLPILLLLLTQRNELFRYLPANQVSHSCPLHRG